VPFSMSCWLEFDKTLFPFGLKTSDAASNKAQNLDEKFRGHMKDFAAQLPLLQTVPVLSYNQDDPMACFFELELPPRTAFYTTNPLLFEGLRMDGNVEYHQAWRMIGAKGRRPTNKDVMGFFNEGNATMSIQGDVIQPGMAVDAMVKEGRFPPMTYCQVEMLNTAPVRLWNVEGEAIDQPATRENAVRVFQYMFDIMRRALDLTANMIDVAATGEDTVTIRNRATPGANIRLVVRLNPELERAIDWPRGRLLEFPLDTVRTFDLKFKSTHAHPFLGADLFPVTMRAACFGNAVSYVQGVGEMTILGILDERGSKYPVLSSGLLFSTDLTYLTVEFLDRHYRRIVFVDGHEIGMIMKFKSI